ncbi:hypothetical protein PIB30_082224 [Stylosanthes scabra]|uniref:Uncharacterized protein n=1 Tax=Stylosanthes scabra TaxID=79078 RepID=A0ABU6QRH5_9FABA|nr:hypothetical protein [Stylosanthes scabra]
MADRQHPLPLKNSLLCQNGNGGSLGNDQGGGGDGGGEDGDDSGPQSDGGSDSDDDTDSNNGDNNNHTNTQRTTRTRTHVSDSIAGGAPKSEEEDQPFSDEIMAYRMPSNLTLSTTLKFYDGIGDQKSMSQNLRVQRS